MKKIISILIVTVLLAAAFSASVFAEDSVNVTVTISDGNGDLAVCLEEMTVTDQDGDGKFTVYDVLATADPDGFEAETTEWGLSVKKLCGVENGGSYGYYVNHQMSMGLTDEVKDGDYVAAFVYVDAKGLSDAYSYIEKAEGIARADAPVGSELLYAYYVGWDEEWKPVTLPIVGAEVYVDGVKTTATTDEAGAFELQFEENGEHVITLKSEERNYACAVYALTIDCFEEAPADGASTDEPKTEAPAAEAPATEDPETQAPANVKRAPQTGDAAVIVLALLAASGAAIVIAKRREN